MSQIRVENTSRKILTFASATKSGAVDTMFSYFSSISSFGCSGPMDNNGILNA